MSLNRRRFLSIAAASSAAALAAMVRFPAPAAAAGEMRVWRGWALGAEASIRLAHPDADPLFRACVAEIHRLERIFSLFDPDSALSRLNAAGHLDAPPMDLVLLLDEARRYHEVTEGAFDATVQPLWRLYADHFARPDAPADGPGREAVAEALGRVDARAVHVSAERISFARPGMAVTLNGIAQGWITDRVAEVLRRAGLEHALLDLGEVRAIGSRPDGRPWMVGLADPAQPGRLLRALDLSERAVATSSPQGSPFDATGRFHHLLDPRTGLPGGPYASLSIAAGDATTADALSTGLSFLTPETRARVLARVPGAEVC